MLGSTTRTKVKPKGKMKEVDPNDEQGRDFDLVIHEEVQGIDVIDLETQSFKDTIKKQEEEI